jgi:hypothetical protein
LLASSFSLFFIVRNLSRLDEHSEAKTACALLSSLVFGLYPLHAEVVAWITGRVDSVVTAFSLASIWCYMWWRGSRKAGAEVLSLFLMSLALLSKEMAITIPATLFAYELFCPPEDHAKETADSGKGSWIPVRRVGTAFQITSPFWLLLGAYFAVRHYALGTFFGGYDDSPFLISDVSRFGQSWLHGLHMLLVPANRELMSGGNVFLICWQIGLAAALALTIFNFIAVPRLRGKLIFLSCWAALSLAPVYKLFSISDNLQGSRLAYLCTAPLAALIGLAFIQLDFRREQPGVARNRSLVLALLFLLIPMSAFAILQKNNSAWADAGSTVNAISVSLSDFYRKTPGDPQVLLVGLPDNIHGAYVARNAVDGMTKAPQLERTVKNCLSVDKDDHVLPFGYLKNSLQKAGNDVSILRWNQERNALVPIKISTVEQASVPLNLSSANLADALHAMGMTKSTVAANGVELYSKNNRKPVRCALSFAEISCFATDFIAVDVRADSVGNGTGADLEYRNEGVRQFELAHKTGTVRLLFSLRAVPDWVLGGKCSNLRLLFAPGTHVIVERVSSVSPSTLMPQIDAGNAGYMGTKGFLHLSKQERAQTISYDGHLVPACSRVVLEVTRANQFFQEHNTSKAADSALEVIVLPAQKGKFSIARRRFPQPGLYAVRPWAIDAIGHKLGVAGDHLIIAVDS